MKGMDMNALTPHRYFSTSEHEQAAAWQDYADSERRGLLKTLQALFREELLSKQFLIQEGSSSWLPLWQQQRMMRFEGLHFGRSGACSLAGAISYYHAGHPPKRINSGSELLSCLASSLHTAIEADDLQRLKTELANSVQNDALCHSFRRFWADQLRADFQALAPHFIAALRQSDHPHPVLLLEQWGTIGHPWHPAFKSKIGLSTSEVMELSPEFHPELAISVLAVRKECMRVTSGNQALDYMDWFATHYPDTASAWQAALTRRQMQAEAWVPVPMHPYQLKCVLPQRFAAELAAGQIVILDEVTLNCSPSMSFRTVEAIGYAQAPHLKLPVGLQMTSAQRTVSPKSAVMGPRISQLISLILQHEAGFQNQLDILPELPGLHWIDADDDRARHLAVLFRANPLSKRSADLFPIPVGSLFADSPFHGKALATELIALAYGDHAEGALSFFDQYCKVVLGASLSAYLLYGIAFEAHQQNSLIQVDQDYRPAQLLVRDFGDLRIFAPVLQARGLQLDAYRSGHVMFDDILQVRDKLLHATFLCQLSELAVLLAASYHIPEAALWNILRHQTEASFDRLRSRCDAAHWASERDAILHAPWPAKSLLKMRLSDSADDVHSTIANPLRTER